MKKSFKELINKTDALSLVNLTENIREEKVSGDTLMRIKEKVMTESKDNKVRNPVKRWIPAVSLAACFALVLGVVVFSGALNPKDAPGIKPDTTEAHENVTTEITTSQTGEAVSSKEPKLNVRLDTEDKFSKDTELGEGSFGGMAMDRWIYSGIRFYESLGEFYMIYKEGCSVYKVLDDGFEDTKIIPNERQFYSYGTYNGCAYVGGAFHCVGGVDEGIFRVDLQSGTTERFIDCADEVTSVAVSGSKIYYSTVFRDFDLENERLEYIYKLKCTDTETKEISVLISNEDNDISIRDVRFIDGNLYFISFSKCVYYITPDMQLRSIEIGPTDRYTVLDGIIYALRFKDIEEERKTLYFVEAFDHNGEKLGSALNFDRVYAGSWEDEVTVYNGKIVSFDKDGFYLEDLYDGSSEKIIDMPVENDEMVSKTVYDGKLYISYRDTIIRYDNGETKTFDMK